MEKTNELNKFLSYIHMGMSVYRIYHGVAEKLNDNKLSSLIVEIEEIFKTHEEKITKLIVENKEEATDSLTAAGIVTVCRTKMKVFENAYDVVIEAYKATHMGLLSSLKFLKENRELPSDVKCRIECVIRDYEKIQNKWINYMLNEN